MALISGRAFLATLMTAVAATQAASAHDLGQMERHMSEAEPYTQVVNEPAPNFDLQDADGRPVSLQDFRGKAVVLYFLYARCKDECPLHSLKIKEVQEQIAEAGLSDQIRFVAIATDTEDASSTAELMRDHPKRYGLDSSNWVFVYGGAVRENAGMALARAYALEFTPVGESAQLHGIVTHLIDPEGRMRARYHGLNFDGVSLLSYAAALLHGDHGPATTDQAPSEVTSLTAMDWLLSAVGVLCLAMLVWVGWSFFNARGPRRGNAASPDS